jgi:DNA repair protein RadC
MYTIREVKLSYIKEHQLSPINNQAIKSSLASADTFRTIWEDDLDMIERFYVLYLDNANKVQSVSMISMGGITGTVVDLRMVFATALKCLATSIIIAHNHPSGSLRPSAADLNLTKKIEEAGKVLDIALLDHIILTEASYYSFRDEGDL